jgi:hypothetical protein
MALVRVLHKLCAVCKKKKILPLASRVQTVHAKQNVLLRIHPYMAIYTKKARYQLALLHLWDALKLISIMENYGGTYMH